VKQETYNQFKHRLITENLSDVLFAKPDKLYGLSREHIEVVLGIPLPLLLESIDHKTEEKILHEQYLFEQFLKSLGNIATQARSELSGVAQKGIANLKRKLPNVKDAAGIFKALAIIFQNPKLLTQLIGSVTATMLKYFDPIKEFVASVSDWLKDKTAKVILFVKNAFTSAKNFVDKILNTFNGLSGWKKATLGIGLLVVGKWAYTKMGGDKVKQLITKIKAAADQLINQVKSGTEVTKAVKDTEKKSTNVEKAKSLGASASTKVKEKVKDEIFEQLGELGKQIYPEIEIIAKNVFQKLGGAAAMAALSAFTGPIGPFLGGVAKIVGNINEIIGTISPITNDFINKYNQQLGSQPAATPAQAAPTATPAPQTPAAAPQAKPAAAPQAKPAAAPPAAAAAPQPIKEHKIKLADILF